MATPQYSVELLDTNRSPITSIPVFVPLDNDGNIFQFTQVLSGYGTAKFRLATRDPLLVKNGDILQPNANHVRIHRNGSVVWQGIITQNPVRNRRYIEVIAREYLYLLKRVLIRHDAADGNGAENYRNFKAGTLHDALINTLNQAVIDGPSVLSAVSYGTVDNPPFPANFTDINNNSIAGQPWTFSDNFQLKFDYRDILYFIDQLAIYSICDYELTKDLVFNYRTKIGTDKTNLVFEYSQYGQIENYNAIRDGEQQVNYLVGIAADNNFNILKVDQTDTASVTKYGKLADVVAYSDVKNKALLNSRVAEELRLNSTPDSEIQMTLNQNAYPLGQYGIGDTVTLHINDHANQVSDQRRIVGIEVKVHNTFRETVRLTTNKPRNQ